jgi:hypothetical protein
MIEILRRLFFSRLFVLRQLAFWLTSHSFSLSNRLATTLGETKTCGLVRGMIDFAAQFVCSHWTNKKTL